jgi:hypothetical protein
MTAIQLNALVSFLSASGDSAHALTYAKRLLELEPDNPDLRQLVEHLSPAGNRPRTFNPSAGSH